MTSEHEIWKPIKNYEGWYEISDYGRVRSLDRFVNHPNKGFKSFRKGKIISPGKTKDGYLFVQISKNQKIKNIRINRLVAQTFISNPNDYPQVNHKDEDKTNNRASNLECARNGFNYGDICACCRGERNVHKGYRWEYV